MKSNQPTALIIRDDVPTLLLLLIVISVPIAAVLAADWVPGLIILPVIAVAGVLIGYLLAISTLNDLLAVLFSTLYGYLLVWILAALVVVEESGPFRERLVDVILRVTDWLILIFSGGTSRDNVVFVFLVAYLVWYLAYNAAWNIFGLRRLWQAVIPPGVGLLANTFYYLEGPVNMQLYVIGYIFLVFMLAARTHIVSREQVWRYERIPYKPTIQLNLLLTVVAAGSVLLALAWFAPTASAGADRVSQFWQEQVDPRVNIEDTWQRMFGGVESRQQEVASYYGDNGLLLGGSVNLGNNPVLYVYAPQGYRYYWRSTVFDTYNEGRWVSTIDSRVASEYGILTQEESVTYEMRTNVNQQVQIQMSSTQLLYAAGQPLAFASLPVNMDVAFNTAGTEYASLAAVRSETSLQAGTAYGVISSISLADEFTLRNAGAGYPQWVRQRYLQVPETVTARTRELAHQIARQYDNPYDVAKAIETYLRSEIVYNEKIEAPPPGVEPVDHVLFDSKEGYCTYYASAMVLMLRTQGIPARMAAGFAQGDYSTRLSAYRVVEADAHTWVEVYFPGYGWIEFEPTAARSAVVREAGTNPAVPEVEQPLEEPQSEVPGLDQEAVAAGEQPAQPEFDPNNPDKTDRPQSGEEETGSRFKLRIPPIVWWLLVIMLLVFAAGFALVFFVERRDMLRYSEVSRGYARLNAFSRLMNIHHPTGDTPYERALRMGDDLPAAEREIYMITRLYVDEQYGRPQVDEVSRLRAESNARKAWGQVRRLFWETTIVRQIWLLLKLDREN